MGQMSPLRRRMIEVRFPVDCDHRFQANATRHSS